MSTKLRTICLLLLLGFALWWRFRDDSPSVSKPPRPITTQSLPPDQVEHPTTPISPTSPAANPVQIPEIPAAERQRVLDAIDNLEFTFRDFANALGGNPVGTNAEITAALLGDNAKQIKLSIPEGSTKNSQGELCDPWGTPWFFHQLSGTKMELRSAGPDRALYTDDDFVR